MARRLKASGTSWGFTKSCTVLDTDPICPSLALLTRRRVNKLIFAVYVGNRIDHMILGFWTFPFRVALGGIERGEVNFTYMKLVRIAKELDRSIAELVTRANT
jgi:hypothetical protein